MCNFPDCRPHDVVSRQSDGTTIAAHYARFGIQLRPANTDHINGWAEILNRLGRLPNLASLRASSSTNAAPTSFKPCPP